MEEDKDLVVQKIVENPRLSLGQFSKYCSRKSEGAKKTIILKAKFPGGYIPRYYDKAKDCVRSVLSLNIGDNESSAREIERVALELKAEAKPFPINRDDFKNREYSGNGLLALVRNFKMLTPILDKYVIRTPPGKSKVNPNTVTLEGVKISSKVDLLLFEDGGLTGSGFVSFNFTKQPLSRVSAEYWLYILWLYHKERGNIFKLSKCYLIDVYTGKLYTAIDERFMEEPGRKICRDIAANWKIA